MTNESAVVEYKVVKYPSVDVWVREIRKASTGRLLVKSILTTMEEVNPFTQKN